MAVTIALSLQSPTVAVDENRNCLWLGDAKGVLRSVQIIQNSPITNHQHVGFPITALALSAHKLAAIGTAGEILILDPDQPSHAGDLSPIKLLQPSQAVFGSNDDELYVVEMSEDPVMAAERVTLVNLHDSTKQSVDLVGAVGLTMLDGTIYVAVNQPDDFPRGSVVRLSTTGTDLVVLQDMPLMGRTSAIAPSGLIVASHPGINKISTVGVSSDGEQTLDLDGLVGTLSEVHSISNKNIIAVTDDSILLFPDVGSLGSSPFVESPAPVFVGSWARLFFGLGRSGLLRKDIRFEVDDPKAAIVSYTKENESTALEPILVVGAIPGKHTITLVKADSGAALATSIFLVTNEWAVDAIGPPGFVVADEHPRGDGAWGGGDPAAPQNFNTHPHTGTWRVLLMLVDTASGRWPAADIDTGRDTVLDNVINGLSFGGKTCSVKKYYEENSGNNLTLSAHDNRVFGVLNLPGTWTDYFSQTTDPTTGAVTDARWFSKASTRQAWVSAAITDSIATTADFQAVDAVLFFPFPADATAAAGNRFAWPVQWDRRTYTVGAPAEQATFAQVHATPDFPLRDSSGRQLFATLSHEVGHTLDLPDLYDKPEYPDEIGTRIVSDWDMMAGSRNTLPHFSLSNKMRMGWVSDPGSTLQLYNFQISGAVSEPITLHAAELASVPSGRHKGIEIRIGDGWNFYVEYRSEQGGFISDDLVTDRRVMITDVTSDAFHPVSPRPPIVFVKNDENGDGRLLDVDKDLKEVEPATQMSLVIKVLSTGADNAVVQVTYTSGQRPEPGIRPWEGAQSHWQSADIEVRNDKTATGDPKFFNVPWLGHRNTVIAKIHNTGDLPCTGVKADFFITEFTTGSTGRQVEGPWQSIGTAIGNIDVLATSEFTAPDEWRPDRSGHYCIIVRIRPYKDPADPTIEDRNFFNNEARSNYSQFTSASASPATRVGTTVKLSNSFADRHTVHALVRKQHSYHRVFTSHQWLAVPPNSSLPIRVWDETLFGTPEWNQDNSTKKLFSEPNFVSIEGVVERTFPELDCKIHEYTGGVGLRIDAARKTQLKIEQFSGAHVQGSVSYVDNGRRVRAGKLLFELWPEAGDYVVGVDEVNSDGFFAFKFARTKLERPVAVVVYYLGGFDAAECESDRVKVG